MGELLRLLRKCDDPFEFNRRAYITGHLRAEHLRVPHGNRITRVRKVYERYDFGHGVVTNVGCMALAYDALWPQTTPPMNLLSMCTWMVVGGTVSVQPAAAATDLFLNNPLANAVNVAVNPIQVTPALISAVGSNASAWGAQVMTGTFNFIGSAPVTEWGIVNGSVLSQPAGTGAWGSAGNATSCNIPNAGFTPSGPTTRGVTQNVFTGNNPWGLCIANTGPVITVPAWFNIATGNASSWPNSGITATQYPVLLDHVSFSSIYPIAGDAIRFTFTLQFPSGG